MIKIVDSDEEKSKTKMNRAAHHKNKTQEWYTPPHILLGANQILGGRFSDPCLTFGRYMEMRRRYSEVICPVRYITPEMDGTKIASWDGMGDRIWMNPPFNLAKEFLEAAYEYVKLNRTASVLTLLPANTSAKWWQKWLKKINVDNICFLNGRLSFINMEGDPIPGNTTGSCLFLIGGSTVQENELNAWSKENGHMMSNISW
jgi:hypothetical protein